jgi:DNA-binding FadR family transcriptional regulator
MRLLFEVEAARKAASRRTETDLRYLEALMAEEDEFLQSMNEGFSALHPAGAADLDFRVHQAVMLASGNEVYPMLFNTVARSTKPSSNAFATAPRP